MSNTRCVINRQNYYKEFVFIKEDGTPYNYELKSTDRLIDAPCPYWVHGTSVRTKWLGDRWDTEPPEIEISASERRRIAYATEKLIEWNGLLLTVDEANEIWWQYTAEGRDMSELAIKIHEAKEDIRTRIPD